MKDDQGRHGRKKGFLNRLLSSISFLVEEDVNTMDQRRAPRVECRCEVEYVDMNGIKGTGFIIDISRSGLQMETGQKLGKGTTLAIKAPQEEVLDKTAPFMAAVRWCKKAESGYAVGLALPSDVIDDPHWLDSLLQQLGYDDSGQRREFIRAKSDLPGVLTTKNDEDAEGVEVEVRNLGMGGALLKSVYPVDQDAPFELLLGPYDDLPELKLQGTVLRVVEQEDHILYPTSFQLLSDNETKTLREYILKFSERS